MAHEISLEFRSSFILRKDVELEVKKDGKKLGTLMVSQGNVEWLPKGNSVNKFRLSWSAFAEMMEENGKSVNTGRSVRKPTKS